jgi:hypothetical protein
LASKISRIETRQTGVTPRDVHQLIAVYGVPEDSANLLLRFAREARCHSRRGQESGIRLERRRRPAPGKNEELEWHAFVFDHLRASALAPDEAVSLIAGMAKEQ